jgi:hypothetical protein
MGSWDLIIATQLGNADAVLELLNKGADSNVQSSRYCKNIIRKGSRC